MTIFARARAFRTRVFFRITYVFSTKPASIRTRVQCCSHRLGTFGRLSVLEVILPTNAISLSFNPQRIHSFGTAEAMLPRQISGGSWDPLSVGNCLPVLVSGREIIAYLASIPEGAELTRLLRPSNASLSRRFTRSSSTSASGFLNGPPGDSSYKLRIRTGDSAFVFTSSRRYHVWNAHERFGLPPMPRC